MDTTIFICQLPVSQQVQIKQSILEYCQREKFSENKTKEIIQNAMSDRLCLLEEIGIDTIAIL